MHTTTKPMLWTGRVLSTLAILFMLMDAVMKIILPPFVVASSAGLGYTVSSLRPIGIALLLSTILYIVPRTAIFGAILLTGYLGGAIDANVHAQTAVFNLAFPLVFAVIIWLGVWLRDARLRAILPLTPSANFDPVADPPLIAQR